MKIFGIGLSKTGTSSLASALEILGYRTKDYLGIDHYARGNLNASIDVKLLDHYDAFTDTPIPYFYRELDALYPCSKFILTTRDSVGWLKSCKKQFTQKLSDKQNAAHNKLFMDLYGCTVFNEEKFRAGYKDFVAGVLQHFKDRPDDLLIMDITGGEGWNELCSFLGTVTPNIPFPMANVTQIRWMRIDDLVAIARSAGKKAITYHKNLGSANYKHRNRGVWQSKIRGSLLEKASHLFHRGNSVLRKTAAKKAHKIILERLGELKNPIPIVSNEDSNMPYSERRTWNHLWLVNIPEVGNHRVKGLGTEFTISIALIEDRKPIMGVVYIPTLDKAYYATAGKEAFMVEHNMPPVVITRHGKKDEHGISSNRKFTEPSFIDNQEPDVTPSCKTLAMCLVSEGKLNIDLCLEETLEWQTAGAHVVLNSSGKHVIDNNTKEELTYNKERFQNDPISIT